MSSGLFTAIPAQARRLQRACACNAKAAGTCASCGEKDPKKLQRRADGAARHAANPGPLLATPPAGQSFEHGGQHLRPQWRQPLEQQYGTSFAQVRVHDDATSHAAARQLSAHAFTVGQHVHFGAGQYAPHTTAGLHLLAHELTHTVQQRGTAPVAARAAVEVDAANTPLEQEADRQADTVVAGRAAQVRAGSAGLGVQARLQRAPAAQLEGTAERQVSANEAVSVTRKLVDVPCDTPRLVAKGESTPPGQVFYSDTDGQAVGFHYVTCKGKVQLETGGEVNYADVVKAGQDLLQRVGQNPADAGSAAQDAINSAKLTASGHVSFTIDKTLDVTLSGDGSAGVGQQTAQVKLRVVVNSATGSVRVLAETGIGLTQTPDVTRQIEAFVKTQLDLGPVSIEVKYTRTSTTPAGGAASSQGNFSAYAQLPLGSGGTALQAGYDKPDGEPGQVSVKLVVPFGNVTPPKAVHCYECRCPPPRPEYTCRRTVKAHTQEVVDQAHDAQTHRLLYLYDSATPDAQQGFVGDTGGGHSFEQKVSGVAALARSGYTINHIYGYASPEAGRSYNQALGLRRARHTQQAIAKALGELAGSAPKAESRGEQLAAQTTLEGKETPDDGLIAELSAKLRAAGSDDARLELLSVDTALRHDPVQRARTVADIHAFMAGGEGGNRIKRRAQWEKLFPHLRRVEVELERPRRAHDEAVAASDTASSCNKEDRAFIDAQLGPVPLEKRLPADQCRPPN
jgi:Domain of unknown function (DUF4157)